MYTGELEFYTSFNVTRRQMWCHFSDLDNWDDWRECYLHQFPEKLQYMLGKQRLKYGRSTDRGGGYKGCDTFCTCFVRYYCTERLL